MKKQFTHTQLIDLLTSEEVAGTTESAKERTNRSLNWRLVVFFIHFNNFYLELLIFYLYIYSLICAKNYTANYKYVAKNYVYHNYKMLYLFTNLSIYLPTYLPTYLPIYLPT